MKDSEGHNYFFAMPPMPWKEKEMAIRDQETDDLIKIIVPDILKRLANIESALSALLEEQEGAEDAKEDTAEE